MLSPRRWIAVLVVIVPALSYLTVVSTPPGPRSIRDFNPDRVAALEVDMWQAYYAKGNVRLFADLVVMLREQYRYTWARAVVAGFRLARAAARFGRMRAGYDELLPDLTAAYGVARDWTHASFDPAHVARAELAWWIARRVPGQDSAGQVGGLIAAEYALLYDLPAERVIESGVLRAEAAKLRDTGGDRADWSAVAGILRDSYRSLAEACAVRRAAL